MQMPATLMDMPAIFDKLNVVYRNQLENEIQSVMGTPLQNNPKNVSVSENLSYKIFLDQSDMYSHILSKIPEGTIESKLLIWVLLEYIRYIFTFCFLLGGALYFFLYHSYLIMYHNFETSKSISHDLKLLHYLYSYESKIIVLLASLLFNPLLPARPSYEY